MSKLQHFLERSHHNLNFVKIWPEKQIFWGVALVQVQWLRTVTRYDLDNLKQCCKRIKTKSQKILRTNCVDVELAWENQPGGLYESRSKELSLREKCPNTEFFLVRIFPHSDWIQRDTEYLSVFGEIQRGINHRGGDKSPRWFLKTLNCPRFTWAISKFSKMHSDNLSQTLQTHHYYSTLERRGIVLPNKSLLLLIHLNWKTAEIDM